MSGYPFTAVVGQDDLKLALLLAALDPAIGGVLLRGEKGSAKTTAARGLATLLPGAAPFAELPLGATEDRVVGTLDLAAVLAGHGVRFEPGLLAAAHGGVLYVDEVNLLADHLVDVLLDVATSGVNRVERDGVSHHHPARFVLVGSMNPEEGELRPQLLDRFGLAVDVVAPDRPADRAEIVRRRLAFDADPVRFEEAWADEEQRVRAQLATASPATLPDELLEPIASLCVAVGVEGVRADLVVARAAAALAGWEGRPAASAEDVRRVVPLALAHRRRRAPFDAPGLADADLEQALEDALGEADPEEGPDGRASEREHQAADSTTPVRLTAVRSADGPAGRRSTQRGTRGRLVADRPARGPVTSVAIAGTVRATALARADDPTAPPVLREAVREERAGNLVILAVDTSGSMGVERRMAAVTGAVAGILIDAYQRRDRVAVVGFRGEGAEVVVRPTGSVEVARARLSTVTTGGRTPLAAGIDAALDLALAAADGREPLLVVVSDGRATAGPEGQDPVEAAMVAVDRVRRRGVSAVVVDAEEGPTRLGLTRQLAAAMAARHLTLDELAADGLSRR